jgi:hypothetical protein
MYNMTLNPLCSRDAMNKFKKIESLQKISKLKGPTLPMQNVELKELIELIKLSASFKEIKSQESSPQKLNQSDLGYFRDFSSFS